MSNFETLKQEIGQTNSSALLNKLSADYKGKLADLNLPHRRIETWKYTNLNKIFDKSFSKKNIKQGSVKTEPSDEYYEVYEINGKIQFIDEDLKNLIEITQLAELKDEEELNVLFNDDYYQDDIVNHMSLSDLSLGYRINIKTNTNLDKPIRIHQYYFGELSFHNYNYIVHSRKNSQCDIIFEQKSSDITLVNSKYSFELDNNSKINHLFIQNNNKKSYSFAQINTLASRDAHFHSTVLNLGSELSRNNIYARLVGENAVCDTNGLFILDESQHHDTNSYIKHTSPNSFSNQLYKGILADESRGVFAGIIRIDQDAQLVNSTQLNKNLLLSKKAHVNSRPQLEIYADDVKCAHGSTTGQLSMDELFYFQARGISAQKAKAMLARAFINDVLLKIEQPKLRNLAMQICENYEVNLL